MKYFDLLVILMALNGSSCAHEYSRHDGTARPDIYTRLHEMNISFGFAKGEQGKTFEIRRYCFPCEKWELREPLPENIIFCGLEIKNEIFYENDVVMGGPYIHEYLYTFTTKTKQTEPIHIAFELHGILKQVSFVEVNFSEE